MIGLRHVSSALILSIASVSLTLPTSAQEVLSEQVSFLRGDCNADAAVNVADAVCSLNYLFAGAAEPSCLASLNTNGDSDVNVVDPLALLNFLSGDGPTPVAPFPDCGPGMLPADQEHGCTNPPDCQ